MPARFRQGNAKWQMIVENGPSRVFGVHWVFDGLALDAKGNPDIKRNVGGVPLGFKIAEDVFAAGGGKGLKTSSV